MAKKKSVKRGSGVNDSNDDSLSLGVSNIKNVPGVEFIVKIAEGIGGKPSRDVVEILLGRQNVNEFLIAKKLDLTINQVRNILYRLSDFGVVSFTRKKDKKKGWYTYFWTLNVLRTLEVAESRVLKLTNDLERQRVSRTKRRFYHCKSCQIEVSEETALLSNFTCIECGDVYELSDNTQVVQEIDNSLATLSNELSGIREALNIERSKVEKKILAKDRSDKRKKAAARKAKRAKTAASKKKAAKKVVKKSSKVVVGKKKKAVSKKRL